MISRQYPIVPGSLKSVSLQLIYLNRDPDETRTSSTYYWYISLKFLLEQFPFSFLPSYYLPFILFFLPAINLWEKVDYLPRRFITWIRMTEPSSAIGIWLLMDLRLD